MALTRLPRGWTHHVKSAVVRENPIPRQRAELGNASVGITVLAGKETKLLWGAFITQAEYEVCGSNNSADQCSGRPLSRTENRVSDHAASR